MFTNSHIAETLYLRSLCNMQTLEQGLCLECFGCFELKARTYFIYIYLLIEIVTKRVNSHEVLIQITSITKIHF